MMSGNSRSLYLSILRAIKQIVVIIETYRSCQLSTESYSASCAQGYIHMQRVIFMVIIVDFHVTGQLVNTNSAFVK